MLALGLDELTARGFLSLHIESVAFCCNSVYWLSLAICSPHDNRKGCEICFLLKISKGEGFSCG